MLVKTFVSCDNIHSSGFILCFFCKNDYKLTQNGGQLNRLGVKQTIMVGLVTLLLKRALNLLSGGKACVVRSFNLMELGGFWVFRLFFFNFYCITNNCHYLTITQYLIM